MKRSAVIHQLSAILMFVSAVHDVGVVSGASGTSGRQYHPSSSGGGGGGGGGGPGRRRQQHQQPAQLGDHLVDYYYYQQEAPPLYSLQYDGTQGVVAETGAPYSIMCYACHYQFEDNHAQGIAGCTDQFVPESIPQVACHGPCAKIVRQLGAKDDFMITRTCMPNCKESSHTSCCLSNLCNGAPASSPTRLSYRALVIVVVVAAAILVSRVT